MLTGALLGALIVILTVFVSFYRGQVTPLRELVMKQAAALNAADAALRKATEQNVALGEHIKNLKQPFVANFGEGEITQLAALINSHITLLHEAPHA